METTVQQCGKCGVQMRPPAVQEASIFKGPKCGERVRVEARTRVVRENESGALVVEPLSLGVQSIRTAMDRKPAK